MVKKLFISPQDLLPGMKIGETILNDYGAIIISEGTILDDHLVNKLLKLGLLRLKIIVDDNIVVEKPGMFVQSYNESISEYKDIISDIGNGEGLNTLKVNSLVNSVLQRVDEKRDIVSCLNQIKNADEYTYTHSVNVSLISMLIGKWMKFDSEKIKLLVQGGVLHDIGKTKVPQEILNKPGKLTKDEFDEMKKHTVYGYRILEKVPTVSKEVLSIVLMHHEKEDGTGYPTGMKGDKINILAKIVAVADIYDAMTSNRVYREKESPFEVFQLLEDNSIGTLNTMVVSTFLSNIAAYYIGDKVRLNTGEIAEIVHINPRCVSKPILKVGDKYIDMLVTKDIKIKDII